MKLFGLKNCDTCRKALKSLQAAGYDVALVDLRKEGIRAEDRARFYDIFGDDLINTRSTTWRGLSDEERKQAPLSLLEQHPALMKRPVIEHEGGLKLGWTKAVQEQLLSNKI